MKFIAVLLLLCLASTCLFGVQAEFRDQKDRARLVSCVGPCLKEYPGVLEFIMKRSMNMFLILCFIHYCTLILPFSFFCSVGLQTMFTGGQPKIVFYDDEEEVEKEVDISQMTAKQIEKLLLKEGCTYRKDDL